MCVKVNNLNFYIYIFVIIIKILLFDNIILSNIYISYI